MLIFLPNIPASTRKSELITYIYSIISADAIVLLRKKGELTKAALMVLKDTSLHLTEYHALVDIEPDSTALRIIKRIRRKQFKGKRIIARRYYPRDWHNDHRLPSHGKLKCIHTRRVHDRRRYHIEHVEDESLSTVGYNDLSHKL